MKKLVIIITNFFIENFKTEIKVFNLIERLNY